MAFPVTLNGRTYTLADFEGTNYVDGFPDALESFVTHAGDIYNTTSTSSVAIGTGSKSFTTADSGKPYQAGTPLRIADAAAPETNFMDAIVTSYSGTSLVVDVFGYAGSGTKTSWTINIGGAKTVDGTLAVAQGGTGATSAADARTNLDVYSKADADSRFLNVSGEASNVTMTGDVTIGDTSGDTLTVNATATFGTFTSTGIDDNATSTAITIDASENVGIGTTSPSTILDVREESTGGSTQIRLYNTDNSNTTTQTASLFLSPDSRGNGALVFAEKENADFSTTASRDVALVFSPVLNNSQTEAMRIDSSGNVGIGTTSPSYPLDVVGPIRINHVGSDTFATIRGPGNRTLRIDLDANGDTDSLTVRDLRDGSERFTVQAGGSVGIGRTPGYRLDVEEASPANGIVQRISATGTTGAQIMFFQSGISNWAIGQPAGDDDFAFWSGRTSAAAGNERMRIDNSGNLLVGKTSNTNSDSGCSITNSGVLLLSRDGTGNDTQVAFYRNGGTTVGTIKTTGSATSYNTSSDYRLKENVVNLTGATDRLNQIPVHRFNFIADPDVTVDGFLAHEVADVVPEAISGAKDEVDDEGNPVYQGIDQSKLVPLLTAALQEAVTRIETLEAEVAALKGA